MLRVPPPLAPPLQEGEEIGSVLVGAFEPATRAMGPGVRACLWVRGCPMRCAGCATPEFLAVGRPEHAVTVSEICDRIDRAVERDSITGVSFSGGEPFAQAPALARIAEHARSRGLSTLSWSGFTRQHLEGPRALVGNRELLRQLDVLIDGPFVQRRANGDPLRGSSNQRIHLLTGRHRLEEFAQADVEVRLERDGRIVTTGVMDYAVTDAALALLGVR
ncbi:radical SAM protein [Candidatus Uhrbacteria bacterium]|nr:radical SAM protein [Candidatus Uhrbacteria bacterium]